MLSREELARAARRHRVGLGAAEREYVIACALEGLSVCLPLGEQFILKGGTALRGFHFPSWRYSEDLDFSVRPGFDPDQLRPALETWFETVQRRKGVTLYLSHLHRADGAARLRAQYVGPLAHPALLLVDLTFDEPLILPAERRPMIGGLFADPNVSVVTYALEELLAEKMRSVLKRGKSRDYYDVWRLLKEERGQVDLALTRRVLGQKCEHKGLMSKDPEDFVDPVRIEEARPYWNQDLRDQVGDLPSFEKVVAELENLMEDFLRAAGSPEERDTKRVTPS